MCNILHCECNLPSVAYQTSLFLLPLDFAWRIPRKCASAERCPSPQFFHSTRALVPVELFINVLKQFQFHALYARDNIQSHHDKEICRNIDCRGQSVLFYCNSLKA